MIATSRRSLITGLAALVAAPAIVKVASLMPVNAALQPGVSMRLLASYEPGEVVTRLDVLYGSMRMPRLDYLSINEVTREAVLLFKNSNKFIRSLGDAEFAADGAKIGDMLRIRLPNDFVVSDGPMLSLQGPHEVALRTAPGVGWNYDSLTGQWSEVFAQRRAVEQVVAPLALAAVVVTVLPEVMNKPVTRRFWSK